MNKELPAYAVEARELLKNVSTEQLKKMWDAYDGTNSPLGFSGEDVHMELNFRGEGAYCAV